MGHPVDGDDQRSVLLQLRSAALTDQENQLKKTTAMCNPPWCLLDSQFLCFQKPGAIEKSCMQTPGGAFLF